MDRFERDLASLKQRVVEMGQLAETMAAGAVRALLGADAAAARQVRAGEPALDQLQLDIDSEAIRLITKYSPAAKDLRLLLMIARIIAELERVGDHATDICEYSELIALPHPAPMPEIETMCRPVLAMLHDALDAFHRENLDAAEGVIRRDAEIDAMDGRLRAGLLARGDADGDSGPRGIGLLLAARSLERIADHATNVCEDVFFVVTGQDIRHRIESGRNPTRSAALPWSVPAPRSASTP
jgi:phosphate transport system protein